MLCISFQTRRPQHLENIASYHYILQVPFHGRWGPCSSKSPVRSCQNPTNRKTTGTASQARFFPPNGRYRYLEPAHENISLNWFQASKTEAEIMVVGCHDFFWGPAVLQSVPSSNSGNIVLSWQSINHWKVTVTGPFLMNNPRLSWCFRAFAVGYTLYISVHICIHMTTCI